MGTLLAVVIVFGGIIAIGVVVSSYLYKSGALGRHRVIRRRVTSPQNPQLVETNEEVVEEDEVVDTY